MNELKIEGVGPHGRMVIEPTHEYGEAEYERDLYLIVTADYETAKVSARRVLAHKLGTHTSFVPPEAVEDAIVESRQRARTIQEAIDEERRRRQLAEERTYSATGKAERARRYNKVSKNRARNKAARQARRKAR